MSTIHHTRQARTVGAGPPLPARLSGHAWQRMTSRGISLEAVRMALAHGRCTHVRGARVHVIGRREVRSLARRGLDLSPHEGVHVVCSPDGRILTVYRNRDLRGLRPRRGRPRRHG